MYGRAADEIERLRAELKEARDKALQEAAAWHDERQKLFQTKLEDGQGCLGQMLLTQYEYWAECHEGGAFALRAMKEKKS
jgi:hypothetical protein